MTHTPSRRKALAQLSVAATAPLLAASPAAAVVYENLHYDAAGLCRSPLDTAAGAEMEARELIGRVRRPVAPGATPPV